MTADPRRRRRRTRVAAITAVLLVVAAGIATAVAAATLRTSQVGQQVEVDQRVVVEFPLTPTLGIAVVDGEDRLTSLVVGVLSPSGVGGSLVTIPVNVDASLGFGAERRPVSRRPYTPGEAESLEALTLELESLLSVTLNGAVVLGPDELGDLVEPHAPIRVDLPQAVVDADDDGREVVDAGSQSLDVDTLVEVLTAIDIDGSSYDHHPIDVAVWTAFAAEVSSDPLSADAPLDDVDRPIAPESSDEFFERLLSGSVGARDIAIDPATARGVDNEDDADFVVLDRRDALLVFAEIAPSLVSTPNESLSFQIIAPFTEEQVAVVGEGASTVGLMRELIGELLFAEGNVVSVQTAAAPEGAATATRLEVADGSFVEAVEEVAPILFGEVEVVEAARVVDGVDVVAVLGTDFLDRRAEIRAEDEAAAVEAAERDDEADFDISPADAAESTGGTGSSDGDADAADEAADEATDGDGATAETDSTDESDAPSDTVSTDE